MAMTEAFIKGKYKKGSKSAKENGRLGGLASAKSAKEKANFKKVFSWILETGNIKQLDELLNKYNITTKQKTALEKWVDLLQLKLLTKDSSPTDIINFLKLSMEILEQCGSKKVEVSATTPIIIHFDKEDKNC